MFGRWPFCKTEGARSFFPAGRDSISLVIHDIPFVILDSTYVVVLAGQDRPYSIGYICVYNIALAVPRAGIELKIIPI